MKYCGTEMEEKLFLVGIHWESLPETAGKDNS